MQGKYNFGHQYFGPWVMVNIEGNMPYEVSKCIELKGYIDNLIDNSNKNLAINLISLDSCGSQLVNILISEVKKIKGSGRDMAIISKENIDTEVLELTGIYKLVKRYKSIEQFRLKTPETR